MQFLLYRLNATQCLRADCLNTGMPLMQTNATCETTDAAEGMECNPVKLGQHNPTEDRQVIVEYSSLY